MLSFFERFRIFPFSNRLGAFVLSGIFCPADSKISVGVAAANKGPTATAQQGIP